jgi:hypothetical protein
MGVLLQLDGEQANFRMVRFGTYIKMQCRKPSQYFAGQAGTLHHWYTLSNVGIQRSAFLVTMPSDCTDDCLAKAANAALD